MARLPTISYNNNEIITALGYNTDWVDNAPPDSQTNFNSNRLGIPAGDFQPWMNNVFDQLLNKIAKTIIQNSLMANPLADIRRGEFGLLGDTLEQIFIGLVKAQTYNPNWEAGTPFRTSNFDVTSMFHRNERREVFPGTVYPDDLAKAFRSQDGLSQMVNSLVASLTESNTAAEYFWAKRTIHEYFTNPTITLTPNQIVMVDFPVDEATSKSFLMALRRAAMDVSFNSTAYNPMRKPTRTSENNLKLYMLADALPAIDVLALSSSYQLGKIQSPLGWTALDDFGGANDIVAALVDRDFFLIFDRLSRFETIWNPEKLYTNYFYHVWQLYSASYFHNAIFFVSKTPVPYEPTM